MTRYIVTVKDSVILPGRIKADSYDHIFTVYAKSPRAALKAVQSAGYRGSMEVSKP